MIREINNRISSKINGRFNLRTIKGINNRFNNRTNSGTSNRFRLRTIRAINSIEISGREISGRRNNSSTLNGTSRHRAMSCGYNNTNTITIIDRRAND